MNPIDCAIDQLTQLRISTPHQEMLDSWSNDWSVVAETLEWNQSDHSDGGMAERFFEPPFDKSFKKIWLGNGHSDSWSYNGRIFHEDTEWSVTLGTIMYSHSDTLSLRTVALFRDERLSLPQFSLYDENILHRIANLVGWQDIDFVEAPEFSKRFLLRGKEEMRIRDLFDADCRSFLMKQTRIGNENRYLGLGVITQEERLAVFCELLQGDSFKLTPHRATSPEPKGAEVVEFAQKALEIYRFLTGKLNESHKAGL